MFIRIILILGVLGHISSGVPLEDPSTDFRHFFDSRIIGGEDAEIGFAPHMAALVAGSVYKSLTCGGSIISQKHVLTAAHCITSHILGDGSLMPSLHVVVGSNSWSNGTAVQVTGYRIHHQYDSWNIKHDIGILTTERIKLIENRVAVIQLHFGFVDGGAKSFVTGWGTKRLWGDAASALQVLNVSTISHRQCAEGVAEMGASGGGMPPPVDEFAEICTYHSPGHGMCHGDSGSALVLKKIKKQIGIVSWGIPCAIGGPDVFVRVGSYMQWIIESVERDNIPL